MRTLFFLLFVIFVGSASGQSIAFTAAVPHTNGAPSGGPSAYGSRLRFDKSNKVLYQWSGSAWIRVPDIATVAQLVSDSLAGGGGGGGGLYGGSGTIPDGTWASMAGDFAFRLSPGDDWGVQSTTANDFALRITSDATTLSGLDAGEPSTTLSLGAASVQLSGAPLNYVTDQSGSYTSRSLVDKAYVDSKRPYKVYTALMSQAGTDDPVVTVLENTLGGTPTWSTSLSGYCSATLSSAFSANKTVCFISTPTDDYGVSHISRFDSNTVRAYYSIGVGAGLQVQVEIRVYP